MEQFRHPPLAELSVWVDAGFTEGNFCLLLDNVPFAMMEFEMRHCLFIAILQLLLVGSSARGDDAADVVYRTDELNDVVDSFNDSDNAACSVPIEEDMPKESLIDFCTNPYFMICTDEENNLDARKRRLESIREEAKKEALAITRREFGSDFSPVTFAKLKEGKGWKDFLPTIYYLNTIYELAMARAAGVEASLIVPHVKKIRNYFNSAVEEQPLLNSDKTKLKKNVHKTILVTTGVLSALEDLLPKTAAELFSSFLDVCGVDGLKENSAAVELNGVRYVIVCPGWMLASSAAGRDKKAALEALVGVLGHELGHHVDWDSTPEIYGPFLSCLAKHHGQATDVFGNEISAEYWNIEVLVQHIKNLPQSEREPARLLSLFRSVHGSNCYEDAGEKHPSGRFMIEVLLRRHPYIHEVMGCTKPNYTGKPGCRLYGPTAEKLF